MKEKIHVTYTKTSLTGSKDQRLAVSCDTMDEAREVAMDLHYRLGCCNVRINECGKLPKEIQVTPYNQFMPRERVHERNINGTRTVYVTFTRIHYPGINRSRQAVACPGEREACSLKEKYDQDPVRVNVRLNHMKKLPSRMKVIPYEEAIRELNTR